MATQPSEEQTRLDLNDRDAKDLLHDFVYRDDMDLNEVAQYLNTDWDDAYNWTRDKLEQAKDEDE